MGWTATSRKKNLSVDQVFVLLQSTLWILSTKWLFSFCRPWARLIISTLCSLFMHLMFEFLNQYSQAPFARRDIPELSQLRHSSFAWVSSVLRCCYPAPFLLRHTSLAASSGSRKLARSMLSRCFSGFHRCGCAAVFTPQYYAFILCVHVAWGAVSEDKPALHTSSAVRSWLSASSHSALFEWYGFSESNFLFTYMTISRWLICEENGLI